MTMPARLTRPWRRSELMVFGGYRVWYEANSVGTIEHVYLPGGRIMSFDEVMKHRRDGVYVQMPSEIRT